MLDYTVAIASLLNEVEAALPLSVRTLSGPERSSKFRFDIIAKRHAWTGVPYSVFGEARHSVHCEITCTVGIDMTGNVEGTAAAGLRLSPRPTLAARMPTGGDELRDQVFGLNRTTLSCAPSGQAAAPPISDIICMPAMAVEADGQLRGFVALRRVEQ